MESSDIRQMGRKELKQAITAAEENDNGWYNSEDLDTIKKLLKISGDIKFQGIEKFNHTKAYLFNAGNLKWVKEDWDNFIKE